MTSRLVNNASVILTQVGTELTPDTNVAAPSKKLPNWVIPVCVVGAVLLLVLIVFCLYKVSTNDNIDQVKARNSCKFCCTASLILPFLDQVMARSLFTRTFKAVNEISFFYHSNETSSAVLLHGTIYLACSCYFWVFGPKPMVLPFKWNLFSSTFTWYHLFRMLLWLLCLWMKSYGITIQLKPLAALLHGAINSVGFYKRDFWTFWKFVLICYYPEWTGLKHYPGGGGVLTFLGWLVSVRVFSVHSNIRVSRKGIVAFIVGWFT